MVCYSGYVGRCGKNTRAARTSRPVVLRGRECALPIETHQADGDSAPTPTGKATEHPARRPSVAVEAALSPSLLVNAQADARIAALRPTRPAETVREGQCRRSAPATNNLEATRPKRFDSASAHNRQTCRGPVGTDGGFPVGECAVAMRLGSTPNCPETS